MTLANHEIQKALRISRAIQEYLELSNQEGLRSTDIYPVLAKKGLVERDRHKGFHFRRFLRKLKDAGQLVLIPQCQYRLTGTDSVEWYFYKSKKTARKIELKPGEKRKINQCDLTEDDLKDLTNKYEPIISNLRIRPDSDFTIQQLSTRKNYPRAYEYWNFKEVEILNELKSITNNIEVVAKILGRQPSAVKRKIGK